MHSNGAVWNSDGDTAELAQIAADVDKTRMLEAQAQVARIRALARAADLAEKQAARSSAKTREHEMALRSIAAELAGVLRVTDRSVQRQIDEARELVHDYPATLAAWEAGRINRSHVRIITDLGMILPAEVRPEYELAALELCEHETPNRAKEHLAVLAERMHPRSLGDRHRDAKLQRKICVRPLRDGMSELLAVLPTIIADGIYDRLTQQGHLLVEHREQAKHEMRQRERDAAAPVPIMTPGADTDAGGRGDGHGAGDGGGGSRFGAALGPGDTDPKRPLRQVDDDALRVSSTDNRTMDQLRADLFADMLLTSDAGADPTRDDDGPGLLGALRAKVQVVVSALTLLGTDDGPASLIGRAPIDPHTARELAEVTGSPLERLLSDPVSGAVLQVDTYKRPARMDRYVRGRDQRCRGFGCSMPAIRSEVDHTHDWALGGKTEVKNLAHLCQRHHSMKQFTPWKVRQLDDGLLEWTSPLGKTYLDTPPVPAVHFTPDAYGQPWDDGAAGDGDAVPAPF
ncbi:HNH endonuclease [Microbacterium sp. GXF7504]